MTSGKDISAAGENELLDNRTIFFLLKMAKNQMDGKE